MTDPPSEKPIVVTAHARMRIQQRGTTEEVVGEAIRMGLREPARRGLVQFRLNLEFRRMWDGRYYGVQQVVPVVADEEEQFVVVTVYTFYFQAGDER